MSVLKVLGSFKSGDTDPSVPTEDNPFVLCLETLLRILNQQYEKEFVTIGETINWNTPHLQIVNPNDPEQNQTLQDFPSIFEFFRNEITIHLANLNDQQNALNELIFEGLAGSFHYCLLSYKWKEESNYQILKDNFASSYPLFGSIVLGRTKSSVEERLYSQGYGRHSPEALSRKAEEDIRAFSTLLGNQTFLFGEKPSTSDILAFGLFWGIVDSKYNGFLKEILLKYENVLNFIQQIKQKYFHIDTKPCESTRGEVMNQKPDSTNDPWVSMSLEQKISEQSTHTLIFCGLLGREDSEEVSDYSPFVMKVEAFLRLHDLPYQKVKIRPDQSPTGKVPVLKWKDEAVSDSHFILKWLTDKYSIRNDDLLSPEEKAIGHFLQMSLEQSLYFLTIYFFFSDPEGFAKWKERRGNRFPWIFQLLLPILIGGISQQSADGGYDTKYISKNVMVLTTKKIFQACSTILSDSRFLFGRDQPSTYDCCLLAFLGQLYVDKTFEDCEPYIQISSHQNLVDYVMRNNFAVEKNDRYFS